MNNSIQRRAPVYAIGTRVTAPLGIALVHGMRWGPRSQAYLVEVAYDGRPGVFTYFESELGQPATDSKPATRLCRGVLVNTPDGAGLVSSVTWVELSKAHMARVVLDGQPEESLYWESELTFPPPRLVAARFVPGEAVQTPAGAAVVRNIVPAADNCVRALVQLIGCQSWREFALADLSPPLEAA